MNASTGDAPTGSWWQRAVVPGTALVGVQPVPFDRPPGRSGGLTWGQMAIVRVIDRLPAADDSLNITGWFRIPHGYTVARVAVLMGEMLERHESLRTLFQTNAGQQTQSVACSGELAMPVFDCTDSQLGECLEAVSELARSGAFNNEHELPVRLAVVTCGGVPAGVILATCHIAVDGWSYSILEREVEKILADESTAFLYPAGRHPLDRLQFENSEAGRKVEQRTISYWKNVLRRTPAVMISRTATPDDALRVSATIRSRAISAACRLVQERTGIGSAAVLLAAVSMTLCGQLRSSSVALRLIAATRARAEDRMAIGSLNQNALLSVELVDETFYRFVRRVRSAEIRAYLHCEADAHKIEATVEETAIERNIEAGHYLFYNDQTLIIPSSVSNEVREPSVSELASFKRETLIKQTLVDDRQIGSKCFIFVNRSDDCTEVALCVDPQFCERWSPSRFLSALEDLLIFAAGEDSPLCSSLIGA